MNTGGYSILDSGALRGYYKAALFEVDNANSKSALRGGGTCSKGAGVVSHSRGQHRRGTSSGRHDVRFACSAEHVGSSPTLSRIAVRLPRSSRRCCAIPFLGSPCVYVSPAALFVHVVEQ